MNSCTGFVSAPGIRLPRAAKFAAALALLCTLAASADPVDWSAYEQSFNIRFPGYTGTETLTDFPVLIRLSPSLNDFKYAKCKVGKGGDLRFSDADGNLLASEVDTWNEGGTSLVWVKVPSLGSDTIIKAHYGNANPPAVDPEDVWSSGYVGVWHLRESALPLKDSSGNGTDFTANNAVSGKGADYYDSRLAYATNGMVGAGVGFDMNEDHRGALLAYDKDPHVYDGHAAVTMELWLNEREETTTNRYLFSKYASSSSFAYQCYEQSSDHRFASAFVNYDGASTSVNPYPGTIRSVGEWMHAAYVYDSANAKGVFYKNGKASTNGTPAPAKGLKEVDAPFCLGNRDGNSAYAFPGIFDEVRISNVARSSDWLKATYDTIANEDFINCEMPNDWTKYSRKAVIAFPGAPETALADFPVLVRLAEYDAAEGTGIEGFSYDDFEKVGGGDLRFADADGNMLAHEIDTWDPSGVSTVWVKVPTLDQSVRITAYYGWKFAPSVDSRAVWSNGYVGVWHLGESARPLCDSSSSGFDFTTSSLDSNPARFDECNSYGEGGGVVGKAVRVGVPSANSDKDGRGGLMALDPDAKIGGYSAMTAEIWAKPNGWDTFDTSTDRFLFSKRLQANPKTVVFYTYYAKETLRWGTYFGVDKNQDGTTDGFASYGSAYASAMSQLEANKWYYHVIRFNRAASSSLSCFLNGAYHYGRTEQIDYDIISYADPLCLGNNPNTNQKNVFPGCLDEFRISNVARSSEWIKATYDTIKENAAFTAYGPVKDNRFRAFSIFIR